MKNFLKTTALVTGMVATSGLMAATDGIVGATSTGTLDISVDVEDLVRISGLSDILLTFDITGTGDIVGSSTACVYRNGAGTYTVNATGSGTANAFTIQDAGPTPTPIAYTVGWDDSVTGAGVSAVSSGTLLTNQLGANTVSDDCSTGGGANAFVEVTVPRASLVAAPAGTYNGTLTLEIAPE